MKRCAWRICEMPTPAIAGLSTALVGSLSVAKDGCAENLELDNAQGMTDEGYIPSQWKKAAARQVAERQAMKIGLSTSPNVVSSEALELQSVLNRLSVVPLLAVPSVMNSTITHGQAVGIVQLELRNWCYTPGNEQVMSIPPGVRLAAQNAERLIRQAYENSGIMETREVSTGSFEPAEPDAEPPKKNKIGRNIRFE